MAKIMISLPDGLLEDLDESASRRGATRSGLLQQIAAEHLRRERDSRAHNLERLLADPGHHGGSGAEQVRADRGR
jgi:metal-responsive CopG/Arc/MetJ family transcriptional regulator